jgi:hypothetical protein
MAFTEAQRVQIRFYLGFTDLFRDHNHRLESAMTVVGDRPATQAQIELILASLVTAEASLQTAVTSVASGTATGGIKKVDEAEFYQTSTSSSTSIDDKAIENARRNCRMYASRLSIMLGVPIVGDVFGGLGYQGDRWMGRGFQGGGEIPLG